MWQLLAPWSVSLDTAELQRPGWSGDDLPWGDHSTALLQRTHCQVGIEGSWNMVPIVLNNAEYTGPEQISLPCCSTEACFLQSIDRKPV